MKLVDANAIEFLGERHRMIVKEGYNHGGFLLSRASAIECKNLGARIGCVLVFRVDGAKYSYNGEYIVHWA